MRGRGGILNEAGSHTKIRNTDNQVIYDALMAVLEVLLDIRDSLKK